MNAKNVRASREREFVTYAEHWHSSRTFLQLGIENPKGSYHQFLGSIVFAAFTLEAFLNHIGETIFESWEELERLPPKAKLKVICEKLRIKPDFASMPWQIVPEIFGIRDKVAHGKNEILRDEQLLSVDDYDEKMGEILRARWQEYATRENAERVREHLEKLCRNIWAETDFDEHALFRSGMQSGTATFLGEIDS